MPWWGWLLVDLFLVAAALAVVVRVGWRFWGTFRAFLRAMSALEIPHLDRR